eukprot:1195746-Prorocentrum_minimum.AAC.2
MAERGVRAVGEERRASGGTKTQYITINLYICSGACTGAGAACIQVTPMYTLHTPINLHSYSLTTRMGPCKGAGEACIQVLSLPFTMCLMLHNGWSGRPDGQLGFPGNPAAM